ncbi:MerR family transcriptional regulator [Microbacterium aurum]
MKEWSIQQIAKLAGTTSRTLRHYGELGLLTPSSVGAERLPAGTESAALLRLQRILLLRELGLGLPQIAEILAPALAAAQAALARAPGLAARRAAPAGAADRLPVERDDHDTQEGRGTHG